MDSIESIRSLANGGTAVGELRFTFPKVLEVIRQCSSNGIAVLGVDILQVSGDSYFTSKMSGYDLPNEDWPAYVAANNQLAEEFISANPTGDQHMYVLTTSSWREFRQIQEFKKGGRQER
jgi:hypothetical protein